MQHIFLVGAKEGMSTVVKIFPTLVGIFVAVGCFIELPILILSVLKGIAVLAVVVMFFEYVLNI